MSESASLESKIRTRLKAIMAARSMSRKSLSESTGMSDGQIGSFFRDRALTVWEVSLVCDAMNVNASWVMFSDEFDIGWIVDESV